MSIYTKNESNIYFLNDKNIISSLTETVESNKKNPIPSFDLVKDLNNAAIKSVSEMSCVNKIAESGYIISSLSQNNGKIEYGTRRLNQEDVYNLTSDLKNISDEYLLTSNFNSTLSGAFKANDFRFDKVNDKIILNVQGNELTIPRTDILEKGFVKKVTVVEVSGTYVMRIWFNDLGDDFVDINLQQLAQVYQAGVGINIIPLSTGIEIAVKDYEKYTSTVDTLSTEFEEFKPIENYSIKFNGLLKNSSQITAQQNVEQVFQSLIPSEDKLYNGSLIQIAENLSDDMMYTISKDLGVIGGDYILIHTFEKDKKTLTPPELSVGQNVFVIGLGQKDYNIKQLKKNLKNKFYNCLSSISSLNNNSEYDECVSCVVQIKNMLSDLTAILM